MDKIASCCKICKYTVTNKLTTISFHKPSYINYTVLLAPWIFSHINPAVLLYTKQLFPSTCYCAAEFCTSLLA